MGIAIEPSTTLGDLITGHPDLASELERRSLDYCCGGRRTLAEACAAEGLDPEVVAHELAERASPGPPPPWTQLDAAGLVDHLEATHHAFLHAELPRLTALAAKVLGVHGGGHPELAAVASTFGHLREELEPHLVEEEHIVFPAVRRLAAGSTGSAERAAVLRPMAQLRREHDHAGALLERLRLLTDGYRVPSDGCASYTALYRALEALEADTHLHVHIENNRLFPLVADLELEGAAHATGAQR